MLKEIIIDGKIINDKSDAYIVAEIGLNHNHDMELTKKMILSAKRNGADAVKFQTYITEKLINHNEPAFQIFKRLELNMEEFREISDYCREVGITFFSTPFSLESVDLLEEIGVPCFKIASMDINYFELMQYAAKSGKPMILSTGFGNLGEIEKAIAMINRLGNDNIIILHCVSKYPPKYSEMNLKMIEKYRTIFEYPVGFSDHSPDNTMAVVSRVMGAVMIEKHFTLDKNLDGPDHSISLEPDDLLDLKKKLQAVDDGLLTQFKEQKDQVISQKSRRSLYSASDFKKGTVVTKDMIVAIRPGIGIAPEFLPIFIGRVLKKDIKRGELVDLSFI